MPYKDRNPADTELTPAEFHEQLERNQKLWNHDYLLTRTRSHAEEVRNNAYAGKDLHKRANTILCWLAKLEQCVADGDARNAATMGIKLGAAAQELELLDFIARSGWPRQPLTAEILKVDRSTVNKWIAKGVLKTNGKTGRHCRVEPASILKRIIDHYDYAPKRTPDEVM